MDLSKKVRRIEKRLETAAVADSTEAAVEEDLQAIYADIVALQADGAFAAHVSKELAEAYRARQNGDREKPLCYCSNPMCDPKNGNVPRRVQAGDPLIEEPRSPARRISDYRQRHPEDVVMGETLESWTGRKADIRRRIAKVEATIQQQATSGIEFATD